MAKSVHNSDKTKIVAASALQRLEDRADLEEALEALAEIEREGTVSWERLKSELEL